MLFSLQLLFVGKSDKGKGNCLKADMGNTCNIQMVYSIRFSMEKLIAKMEITPLFRNLFVRLKWYGESEHMPQIGDLEFVCVGKHSTFLENG